MEHIYDMIYIILLATVNFESKMETSGYVT